MAYTKIGFENKPSKKTPISAENLNHMEQGIYDAHVAVEGLETYKANSILSKSTGEVATTTDSAKAKPKNIRLYGKTEQPSTEGNQLLNLTGSVGGTSNGITVVVNDDLSLTYTGTATNNTVNVWILGSYASTKPLFYLPAGTYSYEGVRLYSYDGTTRTAFSESFELETETPITAVRAKDVVTGNTYNETVYPMLNKGSVVKPYEPYTGREASPNMNYKQPLNSHGDSGSIENKLLSSNMLKYSHPIGYTVTKNGITFTILDDGGINVVGTNESSAETPSKSSVNWK